MRLPVHMVFCQYLLVRTEINTCTQGKYGQSSDLQGVLDDFAAPGSMVYSKNRFSNTQVSYGEKQDGYKVTAGCYWTQNPYRDKLSDVDIGDHFHRLNLLSRIQKISPEILSLWYWLEKMSIWNIYWAFNKTWSLFIYDCLKLIFIVLRSCSNDKFFFHTITCCVSLQGGSHIYIVTGPIWITLYTTKLLYSLHKFHWFIENLHSCRKKLHSSSAPNCTHKE